MRIAVIDKCPSKVNYEKYFDFEFDHYHLSSVYLQKILKKDVDIEINTDEYDFIILIGAEATKHFTKESVKNIATMVLPFEAAGAGMSSAKSGLHSLQYSMTDIRNLGPAQQKMHKSFVNVSELGVPKAGVTKVGLFANTKAPVPVSSLITPANSEDDVAAKTLNLLLV